MPLGHAVMIINERLLHIDRMYIPAAIMGAVGTLLLYLTQLTRKDLNQTMLGIFGSIFIWTGWIEYSFILGARTLNIPPVMENGIVVTRPEYVLMQHSWMLCIVICGYLLTADTTRCNFFLLIRRYLLIPKDKQVPARPVNFGPRVAFEMIMVLWFFYLCLLWIYAAGDQGPLAYVGLAGFAGWSVFLMYRLLQIRSWGPALRYAIPTVVVFWNCIEILGRWNMLKEIWLEPRKFALEMILLLLALVAGSIGIIIERRASRRRAATGS